MPRLCLLVFLFCCAQAFAQNPVVATVVNAASNIPPGLPNAPIAQGALMVIYGSGLGPANLVSVSSYPLPTNLAGTSVRITSSGRNVDAFLYYTSANQVAAIVPSTTPIGSGTLTVSFGGGTSPAAAITIVKSNIGLYTVNSQGTGAAVVTFPDYSYVSPSNAANPGDIVILWADGLGPVATDDAQLPVPSDMTGVPLEILIGGRPADVLYRGRNSCCASLDQINVRIPEGVAGCVTPMVLKIGALVSNTTNIPVAAGGRNCSTNDPSTRDADFQSLFAKSPLSIGQVALLRSTIVSPGAGNTTTTMTGDAGSAFFYKFPAPNTNTLGGVADLPPPGSCAISISTNQTPLTLSGTIALDAGAAISISGPNGVKMYPKTVNGSAVAYLGALGAGVAGNYLDAGPYTISGPGGPDVGAFSATIAFPKPLMWTNQSSIRSVDRAAGLTLSWSGGEANGLAQISGQSTGPGLAPSSTVSARFDCVAKVSDGAFTVPPAVLLALPPTGDTLGTVTVGNTYNRVPFTAAGLDHGFIYFGTSSLNLGIVTYR